MIFTFASWNLNRRRIDNDSRLLAEYISCLCSPFPHGKRGFIDIVALQEVRRSTFKRLSAAGRFAYSFHSLDETGGNSSWGSGLLISHRFEITSQGSFDFGTDTETFARFSNQALALEVRHTQTGSPLRLGSFHVPNGSQHGLTKGDFKRRFGHCIAAWLNRRKTATVFGIDANSPEIDHADESNVKLFRSDSENLFGSRRTHHLRDVYLDHCRSNAKALGAISFKGTRKTATRFDHIWATKDIQIMAVSYGQLSPGSKGTMLYASNGEILSDHAWVAAKLRHPIFEARA